MPRLEKQKNDFWHAPGYKTIAISEAPPYYKSNRGWHFHTVRFVNNHIRNGALSHVSVTFYCGNQGFAGEKGAFFYEVPHNGCLCRRCDEAVFKKEIA